LKANKPLYRRILLKLSGETLAGEKGTPSALDPTVCKKIARRIVAVRLLGVETGIVIGGGNILRGASAGEIPRVTADTMGMLATVINSLALACFIEQAGCPARVLTAVSLEGVGERFTAKKARDYLASGSVVIIAGGTGNPFFTTDTAAALRCAEIGAQALLKATKVDGVYDSDPEKNKKAKRFERITHAEALARDLKVMDATAFSFCKENNIPIIVFKLGKSGNLLKCIEGKKVGTLVTSGGLS
jgi:uridylate kinase